MASTPTHPFIFINFNMVSFLVFMISFSLMNNCHASLGGRKILKKEYTTFDVNSFLSTSCKPSVQGRNRPASLKVTHRYGHCSNSGLNDSHSKPSLVEILAHDQIRVASIQNKRRSFNTKSNGHDLLGDSKATVSAQPGSRVGFSNYVVAIGLGTPAQYLTLAFDTGSSLTWTQCQPCAGQCYQQKDSIFDPSASTSYSNASCDSDQCSQLSSNPGYEQLGCTQESTCVYQTQYGDGSFTNGELASELLTLTPNDVFDEFTFGCGQDNEGLFGDDTDGILGLGRDYFSVVTQTAEKYGNYFSYCLPTQSGSDGHLTFGNDNGAPGNLAFTPFADSPEGLSFYSVNVVAISVGGTQLTTISPSVFQSGGFVIDSGTIITRLPPTAYAALRDAFNQQMTQYPSAPGDSFLDTCYDLSDSSSTPQGIPSISFTFEGNVKVDLGSEEVLINHDQSIFCLAFAANQADTDIGIFGNLQQQTLEVAYDVAGGRLGFGPNGCS